MSLRRRLSRIVQIDWLTTEDELWERRYCCLLGYRWCIPVGRWQPR